MEKTAAINSPIRYAGGKFYARKLILEHIPFHTTYIEPFAGGASIFFAKQKVTSNQLNDLDKELINLFSVIRDHPEELIDFLKVENYKLTGIPRSLISNLSSDSIIPARKDLHTHFKNGFTPKNEIEKAGRWFYLNRTTYSGIMNYQNMYWGYGDKYSMQPHNWPRNILRTSDKLQDVNLTSYDFEKAIDDAPNGALLFIDPPYFNADQDKFYNCIFSKEDHFRLERCLYRNRERLFLFVTYDNADSIRNLYSWMNEIHDKEWNYCIQRTDDQKNGSNKKGKRYKGKEIFLLNYSSKLLKYSREQVEFIFSENKIKYAV
jgi:DNA adenine methylase